MENFVWIIGALIAVWGIIAIIFPVGMKNMIGWIGKGRMVYFGAAIKILFGLILLIFARGCRIPWIILTIGLLTAGGTILFCGLPFVKIQAYLKWWQSRPLWLYRVWGLAAAVFGGLIMYAGVPGVVK
jgi:hypothetical protein